MTTLTIRVDDNVKKEASNIYESCGLNLSSAINMFLRQTIIKKRFPLSVETEISEDYSYTYPEGFFDLCGALKTEIEEPKDEIAKPEDFGI